MSTVLTLAVPLSRRPAGIVGIPRLRFGSRRRCGVNVSVVDTDAPPGPRSPGPGWGPGARRDSAVGHRLLGGGAAQGEVAGKRLVLAGAGEAQRLA